MLFNTQITFPSFPNENCLFKQSLMDRFESDEDDFIDYLDSQEFIENYGSEPYYMVLMEICAGRDNVDKEELNKILAIMSHVKQSYPTPSSQEIQKLIETKDSLMMTGLIGSMDQPSDVIDVGLDADVLSQWLLVFIFIVYAKYDSLDEFRIVVSTNRHFETLKEWMMDIELTEDHIKLLENATPEWQEFFMGEADL